MIIILIFHIVIVIFMDSLNLFQKNTNPKLDILCDNIFNFSPAIWSIAVTLMIITILLYFLLVRAMFNLTWSYNNRAKIVAKSTEVGTKSCESGIQCSTSFCERNEMMTCQQLIFWDILEY